MKIENKFQVLFKGNVYDSLNKYIFQKKFSKIALILDKNLKNYVYFKNVINKIKKKHKIKKIYYYSEIGEPSYQFLEKEKKNFKFKNKAKFDLFISIGGGSTIDFSKGLAVVSKNPGNALKYMGFPVLRNKPVPIIAIPTNCSTGSEVTFNAVFTDKKNKKKLGINSKYNYPILSIYDPKLVGLANDQIIFYSSCASLMRALETYVSRDSNIITKFYSKKSFFLITENLKNALKQKRKESYLNLQFGCLFSMLALSNAGGGAAGILTYMLSVKYNLPQAWTYAVVGIEFLKKNIKLGYTDYNNIAKLDGKKLNLNKEIKKIENLMPEKIGNTRTNSYSSYKSSIYETLILKKSTLDNKNPVKYKIKDIDDLSKKISIKLEKYF